MLRDRWRIDARISRGGVGTVYAATHQNNGSRAAIKVLHPEFSRDADTRSRFLQEGYAANQVNHPGVVRIIDDDTSEDGHAYLVMELLEGELLETRRVRKGGTLPLPDVFEVGEQLLDVLAAAHDKGIVHRDIKPDNLFVTKEGRLKVLDFGFAQMRSAFRPDVTATGFLLGTPGFMSPEQAVGNRAQVDAQTDIWAAGATLFTLLSGEPVHAGSSAAEMLVAAANLQPRSLAAVASGLPPRLVDVVDRAVAFDKKDRWPNARTMQLALRSVSGKTSPGTVSRRSIPDIEPVSDGPTLYEDPMFIEELDPEELVDSASARWRQRPPASAGPAHGADFDDDTLARGGAEATDRPKGVAPASGAPQPPRTSGRPSAPSQAPAVPRPVTSTPPRPPRPGPSAAPARTTPPPIRTTPAPPVSLDMPYDGGTLIMEREPRAPDSRGPRTEPASFGMKKSFGPQTPQQLTPTGPPRPSGPVPIAHHVTASAIDTGRSEAVSRAQAQGQLPSPAPGRPRPAPKGVSRALVFVGVTVVTMLIVIATGMLLLTYGE
ncbi:MAG: Serine/threonine protein kinase [Labilithrix sp.]|nr:Serine/threonine protein kinase [Labilithrix sp.]